MGRLLDIACYYLLNIWPLRWAFTKPWLWVLERAGRYAFAPEVGK